MGSNSPNCQLSFMQPRKVSPVFQCSSQTILMCCIRLESHSSNQNILAKWNFTIPSIGLPKHLLLQHIATIHEFACIWVPPILSWDLARHLQSLWRCCASVGRVESHLPGPIFCRDFGRHLQPPAASKTPIENDGVLILDFLRLLLLSWM